MARVATSWDLLLKSTNHISSNCILLLATHGHVLLHTAKLNIQMSLPLVGDVATIQALRLLMSKESKSTNVIETNSLLCDHAWQHAQIPRQTVTTSVVTVKALHISSCCAHVRPFQHSSPCHLVTSFESCGFILAWKGFDRLSGLIKLRRR